MATDNDDIKDRDEQPDSITDANAAPVVDLDADSGDDDSDEPRKTRKERRAERSQGRWSEMAEANKKLQAQLEAMQRQIHTIQAPQTLRQQQQAPEPARQQQPESEAIWEQQQVVMGRLQQGNLAKDDEKQLLNQWRGLDRKRRKAEAEEDGYAWNPSRARLDPVEVQNMMLQAEYPDIFQNPNAQLAARHELAMMVASGASESLETARKAAAAVRNRMGMGAQASSEPTDSQRAKYSGTTSRPAASSGSGKFQPSTEQLRLARAWSRGRASDDREAVEMWLREVAIPSKLV